MATGDEASRTGTIVSYNLHGCRGRDGVHDINRCVSVLLGLKPLIVGLQEVDSREGPDVWRIFSDELEMYPLPGPTLFKGNGHYGNLLLTRYPVQHVRHHDLGVSGREPRRAIDAVVEVPDATVRVIVTHLGLNGRERRRQLGRLAGYVARGWGERPVIVMGDFNEWLAPGRLAARIHPALTCPGLVRTFPARVPLLALDQIFCYPTGLLTNVDTLHTAFARIASDHLPLVAELKPSARPP